MSSEPLDDATRMLVLQCLQVGSWSQVYALVRDHPELLDEPVDALLADLYDSAPQAIDDPQQVEPFRHDVASLRHILQRCRDLGPADAIVENTLQNRARTDAEFGAAIQAMDDAGQRGDDEQAVAAARAALAMVDPAVDPATWAAVAEVLATALFRWPGGDQETNLRTAYEVFQQTLAIYSPRTDPAKWAGTHHAMAQVAEAAGAADTAIGHLDAAVAVPGLREREPETWALAHLDAARLHLGWGLAGSRDDLARATERAGHALEVLAAGDAPDLRARAHGTIATALHAAGGSPGDVTRHARQALRFERDPGRVALLEQMADAAPPSHSPEYEAVMTGVAEYGARRDPLVLEDVVTNGEEALAGGEGEHDAGQLKLMLGLAYSYRVLGDRADNIERAIALLEEAADVIDDQQQRAGVADALGTCFVRRVHGRPESNRERAIGHYEAALALLEASGDRHQWAMVQWNMATAYWNPDNPDWAPAVEEAIRRSHLALSVLTKEDHPYEWSGVHVNLAAYYMHREEGDRAANIAQAIEHSRQALEVRTRDGFEADWAQIQLNLAGAHVAGARLDADTHGAPAVEHMRLALEVYRPDTNPHECRRLSQQLGDLLFSQADWDGAVAAYRDALAAAERLYDSALFRRSRNLEIVASGDLYHRLAFAEAQAGRAEDAAAVVELARGRALREVLGEDVDKLVRLGEADPGLLESYLEARQALEYLEKWERSAEGTPVVQMTPEQAGRFVRNMDIERTPTMQIVVDPDGMDDARDLMRSVDRTREERTRAGYQEARSELDQALTRIRAMPGLADFGADPGFEDVAEAADPGLPLAYLVATPAGSGALLVHRGGGTAGVEVEALWSGLAIADVAEILAGRDGTGYLAGQSSVADLADVLGPALDRLGQLVRPLALRLRELGHDRVAVVPAGWLGSLPWHAARWPEDGTLRYLLDDVAVTYVPSAHAVGMLRAAAGARDEQAQVLCGLADPEPTPEPLPYGRDELLAAAAHFPEARTFYGSDATRANLLASVRGASHLHLACHGVNDWSNPLFSHFDLPDEQLDMRDVRYTATEAFGTLRLAVLSACESAISSLRMPDEMIGLPSALLLAGVPATVGTLWPAPDLPAALLMTRFYELLRKGDGPDGPMVPMQALSSAQRWLRDATMQGLRMQARGLPHLVDGLDAEFGDLGDGDQPFRDSPVLWAAFASFGL